MCRSKATVLAGGVPNYHCTASSRVFVTKLYLLKSGCLWIMCNLGERFRVVTKISTLLREL